MSESQPPTLVFKKFTTFDLLLMMVEVWKNFVLRSGQVSQVSLDFDFQSLFLQKGLIKSYLKICFSGDRAGAGRSLLNLINPCLSGLNFPLNSPKMNGVPSNQRYFCMELFSDHALSRRALNRLISSCLNDCFT